jgi:hypothetical protein
MIETLVETKNEIAPNGEVKSAGLPDELRSWFVCPDEWIKDQESLEMRHEWLLAEHEDVIRYVKLLKKLVVYLAEKTEISADVLSRKVFSKAEQYLPEHVRKEIEVGK